MSDHDELAQRIHNLAGDASQRTSLPGAPELRRRANRRSTVTVVAASLATASVVIGGWAVAAPDYGGQSLQPASPSTSTSAGVPSSTTATAQEPPTPPPTGSAASPTAEPPSDGWVTTIPANVKLPHEGVEAEGSDDGPWKPDPSEPSWRLQPCLDQDGYPSDAAQTDRRSIMATGVEYALAEQLALYPDAATAAKAVQEMRDALATCAAQPGKPDRYGDTYDNFADSTPSPVAAMSGVDEAFHAFTWYRMYNEQGQETGRLGGQFVTVVQVGNAIYLSMRSGESDYSDRSQVGRTAEEQDRETREFVPTLCTFAPKGSGCRD